MATKIFKAVILGAPASGKGTISSRIVKKFNFQHISSGDKLRMQIKNDTSVGLEAQKYIAQGKLVPDSVMIAFILDEIRKTGQKSWLLDGFPRTLSQAQKLWKEEKLNVVINLNVPFDVIIERVQGRWVHLPSGRVYNNDFNAPKVPGKDDVTGEPLVQREDDKLAVVSKRLQQYEKLTLPVVKFYKDIGILQEFQGRTSDEIWPKVEQCLNSFLDDQVVKIYTHFGSDTSSILAICTNLH